MRDKHIEPECYQIADNIKRIIYNKHLTQEEISRDTGISRSNIYYILNGQNSFTLNSLIKIAKALNVRLQEIIGDVSKDWKLDELTKEQKEIVTNLINYFLKVKIYED